MHTPVDASRKSSLSARGAEADSEKKDLNDIEHIEELGGVTSAYDDSIEDAPPSRAVWLITFTVAMGGFLFGKQHCFNAVLIRLLNIPLKVTTRVTSPPFLLPLAVTLAMSSPQRKRSL
jgi:hypothetical protein